MSGGVVWAVSDGDPYLISPSLHGLTDDRFPIFRSGSSNVAQVDLMVLANSFAFGILDELVYFLNSGAFFGEWPAMENLSTLSFR